ncbi:MAG: pyridoxal phosphate-dependent aminotransferase [bacterium]|nr:pyridoxal phosphate-dependent aminotransferase [bacterium]
MKSLSKVTENTPEALSLKFNLAADDLRHRDKDIIDLSSGETFFNLPLFDFKKLNYKKGFHYSSSLGTPELRKKIKEYYFNNYGVKSAEKEILVSAGSKIIIYLAFKALVNPGDEVIILEPAWVSYPEQVRLAGGKSVMVPHGEKLEKYITAKTKAIVINNPQNPSGKVFSRRELTGLFNLAKQKGIYIIADEVYGEFVSTEPFISLGEIDKKKTVVLVVNSLSKTFGISGLRLGYVIANEKYIKSILKLNQHLITCATTLIEQYVAEYFSELVKKTKPQIKQVIDCRMEIGRYLDKIGLAYLPGSATLYFMVSLAGSKLNDHDFCWRLLRDYQVAAVPGTGYGRSTAGYIRVGVGAESEARIKRGLNSVKKLIELTVKAR